MDNISDSNLQTSRDDHRKVIGKASFAITARIAMQLGRESISNSIVAIIELVKNAYDADAEKVIIRFSGLETEKPILIIDDDGSGMNQQQFVERWLVIGTDNKLVSQRSGQKRRVLIGEKGLGRLGLDRLCESTLIQTFTIDNDIGLEFDIDWRRYEHTSAKLESIEHYLYQIPNNVLDVISEDRITKKKGTRLMLIGLKDAWTNEELRKLYIELALLVSPFGGVNDFSIELYSDNSEQYSGKVVSEDLLGAADWKVVSNLSYEGENAMIHHIMSSSQREAVFEFLPTPWSKAFPDQRNYTPECGPLRFEFYFIPREDIDALSLKKAQVDKFMNSNQGIRIYRDSFRVMPYGKPSGEGDWLNLSLRRTRSPGSVRSTLGGWKIGYNQVVGAVFIDRAKNSTLVDQTNREGIVESPAFSDLKRFALHAIDFFEHQRQLYEKAQGPKKDSNEFERARNRIVESTQASKDAVDQLKATVESTVRLLTEAAKANPEAEQAHVDLSNKLTQIVDVFDQRVLDQQNTQEQLIEAADKRDEERQEEFQKQKDTLGNLASLGILATTFGHETEASSTLLIANSKHLLYNLKQLLWVQPPDVGVAMKENVDIIAHEAQKINTFASFTLRNVSRDKRQRKKVYLDKLIKKVFESFSISLEQEMGIKIILDFPPEIPPINAFSIDWESIIINFITNAVCALEDTPKLDRCIRVRLRADTNRLQISFADSGHGIAAGTSDRIFLPTFSTKQNRNGDVIGTGMGLAIIQNFVESYGGTIHFTSPCDLGGVEFQIEVDIFKS